MVKAVRSSTNNARAYQVHHVQTSPYGATEKYYCYMEWFVSSYFQHGGVNVLLRTYATTGVVTD